MAIICCMIAQGCCKTCEAMSVSSRGSLLDADTVICPTAKVLWATVVPTDYVACIPGTRPKKRLVGWGWGAGAGTWVAWAGLGWLRLAGVGWGWLGLAV